MNKFHGLKELEYELVAQSELVLTLSGTEPSASEEVRKLLAKGLSCPRTIQGQSRKPRAFVRGRHASAMINPLSTGFRKVGRALQVQIA
jgi:hypothetical protein